MSNLIMPSLDRRRFLQGTAATGLLAAAPLGRPARAAPSKGGSLRVGKGHGNTTDTLNPGTWDNGYVIAVGFAVHGRLTEVAPDGSLIPELAESWEASADAATWRFKLRSGLTFHSGRSVTPEDVVDSINFHRGEGSTSAAGPLVAPITEISIDGDMIVFALETGNADFPFILSDYHLTIHPSNGDGTIDWQSGDGCGAYRLVEFNPGVTTKFEKFDGHFDADNRAWFNEIEMLALVDLNARTTALVSGDVDAIDKLDLKTVGLLGRNPGVSIHSVAGTQHYTFAMDTREAPYNDVNVRLALKHAINREELVEKILFGYGSVGNDHPIGSGQRFFNSELEQRTYDPDRAKFHLKEAGLDSLSVSLSVADAAFPGAVDAGVLFREAAAPAGIDIEVNRVPNDGYWSDVWMKDDFCAVYWGGRPVEDQMFATAYASGAAWNDSFWEHERFNELLVKARAELDEARRREMYHEMQRIVNEEGGVIIPMFASYVFATNPSVATPEQFGSNWDMDGERWMERWWQA